MRMEWSMPNFHNFEGKLVQFTNAEEAELTAKKQAWIDGAAARAWEALRRERDNKIAKSDWRANSDVEMSKFQGHNFCNTQKGRFRCRISSIPNPGGYHHV